MFSHIMIGTNDLEGAKTFSIRCWARSACRRTRKWTGTASSSITPTGVFSVTQPINGEPATCANGMTIGFNAKSPADIDAWHEAGIKAGGIDLRGAAGHPRRRRRQDVSRLSARSGRAQAVRPA